MLSDVPLGAFLSGGIDSSAIVAEMSLTGKGSTTYTVGYSPEDLRHEIALFLPVSFERGELPLLALQFLLDFCSPLSVLKSDASFTIENSKLRLESLDFSAGVFDTRRDSVLADCNPRARRVDETHGFVR